MKLTTILSAALFAATVSVASADNRYEHPRYESGTMDSGQSVTTTGSGYSVVNTPGVDLTLPQNAHLLSNPRQPCRYPSNLYRAGDHCFEEVEPVVVRVKKTEPEPVPVEPLKVVPPAPAKPENG